jgi:hypothetical protein
MKLLRLATIYLAPPPKDWDSWEMTVGRCTISTLSVNGTRPPDGRKRLLVGARVVMESAPEINEDGLIKVPVALRRECEQGIEATANIISVLTRSSRQISSPLPPLALVPESDCDRAHLMHAQGFDCENRAYNRPHFSIPASPTLLEGLTDRLDGVALVADLLAQSHPLARYREAVRFFETAFRLPAVQLEKKLAQFLSPTDAGYERSEIALWLSYRHAAMHGDRAETKPLAVEADVRPFIARIEQAVIDVLFNKADWHSPSRTRRALFIPPAVTTGPLNGLRIIEKSEFVLESQLLDPFGAYPLDLSATLSSPPTNWWCPFGETQGNLTSR